MHKDHLPAASKYKVWFARKMGAVQTVTVTHSMDNAADEHFGLHPLALDAPHILAAANSTAGHFRVLHGKIKGQVGYVFQPFALNHDAKDVFGFRVVKFLHRGCQLVQGEVIHAINIAGAKR